MSDELSSNPTVAPLTNVGLVLSAIERARARSMGLPGIVEFHGPSGFGKTTAVAYAATKTRAYYVQMQSVWSRRAFLGALAREMGLPAEKTVSDYAEKVCEQLALSARPLIIDEADVLVAQPGGAGLVKDLYESTLVPLVLVGEERLPEHLKRWERLHGRVLEWIPAQPANLGDARALTRIYAPGVAVAEDLLVAITQKAKGSVRRIVVNLDMIRNESKKLGWSRVDLATWGDRPIYTGEHSARKVAP